MLADEESLPPAKGPTGCTGGQDAKPALQTAAADDGNINDHDLRTFVLDRWPVESAVARTPEMPHSMVAPNAMVVPIAKSAW